jgi:hypothetical protein
LWGHTKIEMLRLSGHLLITVGPPRRQRGASGRGSLSFRDVFCKSCACPAAADPSRG